MAALYFFSKKGMRWQFKSYGQLYGVTCSHYEGRIGPSRRKRIATCPHRAVTGNVQAYVPLRANARNGHICKVCASNGHQFLTFSKIGKFLIKVLGLYGDESSPSAIVSRRVASRKGALREE